MEFFRILAAEGLLPQRSAVAAILGRNMEDERVTGSLNTLLQSHGHISPTHPSYLFATPGTHGFHAIVQKKTTKHAFLMLVFHLCNSLLNIYRSGSLARFGVAGGAAVLFIAECLPPAKVLYRDTQKKKSKGEPSSARALL